MALLAGVLIINTGLRVPLGLAAPGGVERQPDRHAEGLRFVGKWVLRLGVILLGLKVDARMFGMGSLAQIFGVVAFTLPATFFVVHALAVPLGVRRPLADLIAGGTMICGASAVSAIAPVVEARRQEQGIALATVFLFSVTALLLFRPIAIALGLDPHLAGLWSGLAVNDLSSALAVGSQMGPGGAEMAAASKSARVLLLAPALVVFAVLRSDRAAPRDLGQQVTRVLPRFVVGYAALVVLRMLGDRAFGAAAAWHAVLTFDRVATTLCLVTVSAGIGLHIDLKGLLQAGPRVMALGAAASTMTAALALSLLMLMNRGAAAASALLGSAVLLGTFGLYRLTASTARQVQAILRRFEQGAPLSLREAVRLLSLWDARQAPDNERLQRLMRQLHPSIGEMVPVRESPLGHGEGCRWATYWEGASGWALVAVCREPGAVTPIHSHSHRLLGKTIAGRLEEIRFALRDRSELQVKSRRILDHDELVDTAALELIHIVRVAGDAHAIDLQLRGPESGWPGIRYATLQSVDLAGLVPGACVRVATEVDDRPGQAGEGPAAGLLPVDAVSVAG